MSDALSEMSSEMWEEYQSCFDSFPYFCKNYLNIFNPATGNGPFELFGFQKDKVYPAYQKYRFNIIRKFRQAGLSTMTAAYVLWLAIFNNDQSILVVSKSDREAINFMRMVREYYRHLPEWLRPEAIKNNEHWLEFGSNGSKIMGFTPTAGRSYTCTLLVVDEAAFIPKMDEHWASMFPTLSTGGRCIVISTVNGTTGIGKWYFEQYAAAVKGDNDFHAIDLSYKDHPQYNTEEWVEQQKRQLGEKRFRQEVLGDFEGSRNTYINNNTLKRLADRVCPPKWKKYGDKLWIWEAPVPGEEYMVVVDVAEGLGSDSNNDPRVDHSSLHVFKQSSMEQVAEFYSNACGIIDLADMVHAIGNWYGNALAVVENNGIGGSVLQLLQQIKGYYNLYWGGGNNRPGFHMGANKPRILNKMRTCIENNVITIRSERTLAELKVIEWDEKRQRVSTPKFAHDDLVMPLAIAIWVRDEAIASLPPGYEPDSAMERALIERAIQAKEEFDKEEKPIEDQLLEIAGGNESQSEDGFLELIYKMNSDGPSREAENNLADPQAGRRPRQRYLNSWS